MTVYICIDDKNGIAFNKRRQSRDSAVISRIIDMSKGSKLLMSNYSAKLFANYEGLNITADDAFFELATPDDHVFAETAIPRDYSDKITKLVVFKWNKVYPSDTKLDLSFADYTPAETIELKGTSHDKITCEVWVK